MYWSLHVNIYFSNSFGDNNVSEEITYMGYNFYPIELITLQPMVALYTEVWHKDCNFCTALNGFLTRHYGTEFNYI